MTKPDVNRFHPLTGVALPGARPRAPWRSPNGALAGLAMAAAACVGLKPNEQSVGLTSDAGSTDAADAGRKDASEGGAGITGSGTGSSGKAGNGGAEAPVRAAGTAAWR